MNTRKIRVQLDFNICKKTHSLFDSFFTNPPEGIEYSKSEFKIVNKKNYSFLGKIYGKTKTIFPSIKKLNQKFNDLLRKESNTDLIHFAFHLGNTKKPCVVDYETAYTFMDRKNKDNKKEKKKIINKLKKKNIKHLMPIHEEALKSFKLFFGTEIKIPQTIIYPTILIPKKFRKSAIKKKRVIFISTSNILTDEVFLIKGGLETLKAFEILSKKFPNYEFIILGKIPKEFKKKFPKNLILIEGVPREKMWELFNESQIFVQPSYQAPAMAFIEAMFFKLPIITSGFWGNKEFVDKTNGIILDSEKINHLDENNVPFYSKEILEKIRKNSNKNSEKIAKSVEKLISSPSLRKKLGEAGFQKVTKGKFSIEEKNKKLRKLYEKALE